jgi:hypothetical protein
LFIRYNSLRLVGAETHSEAVVLLALILVSRAKDFEEQTGITEE